MPKITKIEDDAGNVMPLRVTRRKATGKKAPSFRVKCGCCSQAFEIYFDDSATGDPCVDFLEIGGVNGTVAQWRELLLPLLQMPEK